MECPECDGCGEVGCRLGGEVEMVRAVCREAGGVADGTEEAGGVVVETGGVEDADVAVGEVGAAVERVDQGAKFVRSEGDRQRVDGEVAAAQVCVEIGRGDERQRAGVGVGFAAGGDQVDGEAAGQGERGGAEGLVQGEIAAELRLGCAGDGQSVADDDHVEIVRRATEQEVAHRATDEVRSRAVVERQRRAAGEQGVRGGGEAVQLGAEVRVWHGGDPLG